MTESPPAGLRQQVDRAAAILGDLAVLGAPLGAVTTYRVGGPAAIGVTVRHDEDLAVVGAAARASGLPLLAVGRGSNMLVADTGFPGIAVFLDPAEAAYGDLQIRGREVVAGAAVALPALARRVTEAGLTGLEWAVGVPGSVGGGVRMNAGGHGSDISRSLRSAWIADLSSGASGQVVEWPLDDLDYAYRHSAVQAHHVVLRARFAVEPGDPAAGRETIREIVRWRREHQPGGQNAGSVFTNPEGEPPANSAGWLIERTGLKGTRQGTATVSEKHANFIQADDQGSADDVLSLIRTVQRSVFEAHGITLTTEVRLIGFPPDALPSTSALDSRLRHDGR